VAPESFWTMPKIATKKPMVIMTKARCLRKASGLFRLSRLFRLFRLSRLSGRRSAGIVADLFRLRLRPPVSWRISPKVRRVCGGSVSSSSSISSVSSVSSDWSFGRSVGECKSWRIRKKKIKRHTRFVSARDVRYGSTERVR
jgi:hypothetical protein